MGFLVKKTASTDIVKAKVTLTSANLLTPGYIYDIPEYPAVNNYYWNVIYMIGFVINPPAVPIYAYIGTSQIHIQAQFSGTPQFRFQNTIMQFTAINFNGTQNSTIASNPYEVNNSLQIHNPGILTGGTTELDIFIGANLIQY
jgi:hypothetical protein